MLVYLKEYNGDKTHEHTKWYMFETADTTDKSQALWVEEDDMYKNVLSKDITVLSGNTNFLLAIRVFDNDSVEEALLLPLTQNDVTNITPIDMNVQIESPTIKLTSNTLSSGGSLVVTSSEIRPQQSTFQMMSVIVVLDGVVIDCIDKYDLEYELDNSKITIGGKKLEIKISHTDIYGTMSEFGIFSTLLNNSNFSLRNKIIIPIIDYKPIFVTPEDFELISLKLTNGDEMIHFSKTGKINSNILEYGKEYILTVEAYVNGDKVKQVFDVNTVARYATEYIEDYEYVGFKDSDMSIIKHDGRYDSLQSNKVFVPIDKDTYSIKFLNSNTGYYNGRLNLTHEPDFDLPIQVFSINRFEVMFFFIDVDNKKIMTRYRLDPTLYRATKLYETEIEDTLSNVIYNNTNGKMYVMTKSGDNYFVSTITSSGTIDNVDEVLSTTEIGDNLYLESSDNNLIICGEVDGFIQYNVDTKRFQILKTYNDTYKQKELFVTDTINRGMIMMIKGENKLIEYNRKLDTITEYELPIRDANKMMKMSNGGILFKNDDQQTIFF